jgi:hypothetical protein
MDEELVQIEVERGGQRASVRKGVSRGEVAGLVRTFKGEPDVTLIISREGDDRRLLVAVSGAKAFVGLDDGPDGTFQFVARDKHVDGTQRLIIAGQGTDIESRSVLCVETAASVAHEWLQGGRQSSLGAWERQ